MPTPTTFISKNISVTIAALLLSTTLGLLAAPTPQTTEPRTTQYDPDKKNLLARSTILYDSHYWTLVPKNAIIHIPQSKSNKVLTKPKGKFLIFKKFLTRNSSWLQSFPVSLEYARGEKRFGKHKFDQITRSSKIIVTTYKRGAITLNKNAYPLPEEENTQPPKK